MVEHTLYAAALAVISIVSLLAVLCHKFDDNLTQRIGLAMTCLGALVWLLELIQQIPDAHRARYLLTYGIALFCLGTAWKFWRK